MMTKDTKGFPLVVEEVEEHEDGSATYQFRVPPESRDALVGIGIDFVLACAAYGWDMVDALKALERKETKQ